MPSRLPADFEQLWKQGSPPPDVIQFLKSRGGGALPEDLVAVVRIDQQHRWKTNAPLRVEHYLAPFPQLRANPELLLELTAGEFLARLQNDQLPQIEEYIKRFPQLREQLQRKLSGLSSTNDPSGTSQQSGLIGSMALMQIDEICDDFEDAWKYKNDRPSIEDHLQAAPDNVRPALLKELLRIELCCRREQGEKPTLDEYRSRFPVGDPIFSAVLADWEQNPKEFLLHDRTSAALLTATVLKPAAMISSQSASLTVDGSQRIDHFRLLSEAGHGAFGRVFRAYDEQLERAVAIKVPRKSRFKRPEDAEAYLAEARMVARLEHPQIVSVYQMGRTVDGCVYVVSQFIEGGTLEDLICDNRPDQRSTATLIAEVARALHYAHQNRLVHRDIKPANILIEERTGKPFVADFGLAMKEEDYIKQVAIAGSPAYMSPEQARAEGHRLDGRSDVFSLGVVLYEMLTGKKPFRGSTVHETLHQVISVDPRPPRAIDETIPAELERICLKSISKKVSDRYATAELMAEDLEAWLQPATSPVLQQKAEVQVVPKGLRSFDAHDADFFLDLLPGTRNRDGLPESIAFWKQRIEETDPERTFNVGLIYGPSGCGKSSLVKAGLLPHLSKDVIAVYLEATPEETELRILRGLRKRVDLESSRIRENSDSPAQDRSLTTSATGLVDTLIHLRRAHQQKIVIIIDQFEQWLHAHRSEPDAELVQALRQCDGVRVQAIVMIRDDFAMAAARFMNALDVSILQGHNFATIDLFEIDHAKNVLIKFGQAFGKLPANRENLSPDEQQFVDDVATGLAQDGKVVSVRLSLFAEMVKNKRWTSETLQSVGGTQGIGVNFLEETFSSPQANPRHRLHATACRAILKSLLPEVGSDIKGHMRSQQELLKASGYVDRPADFNDLLRILDGELRLITPTDPEGDSLSGERQGVSPPCSPAPSSPTTSPGSSPHAPRYFQLTHDYLVPSLREWLTRKQQETRKGRAELKLAERSALWHAKPENRHLPSLLEWLSIRSLTEWKHWTDLQRTMMSRAFRVLGLRTGLGTGALLAFVAVGIVVRGQVLQRQEATRIEGLVGSLMRAEPAQVPEIVKELEGNQEVAATYLLPLVSADAETVDEKRSQLHARLATVARDKSLIEPLLEELLTNKVAYIGPIRQQLRPYAVELTEKLRAILRDEKAEVNRRFYAAVALADYVPESEAASWTEQDLQFVAGQLVLANAEFQPLLRENLRPISGRLLADLDRIFGDAKSTDAQRLSAANAFADYAASDIPKLSRLLVLATPEQYAVLYPLVAATPAASTVDDLGKIAATLPPAELGSVERVPYGQRRANAAVTLLRLGEREKVLPVFDMTDDPEAMTQFIFRCRDRGVRVEELLELLRLLSSYQPPGASPRFSVGDASGDTASTGASALRLVRAKYALLLALGEYTLSEIPETQREALLKQLGDWYRNDPSSGVHGASGWLLRHWGQNEVVRQVDQTAVPYAADREWFTLAITVTPTAPPKPKEEPTEENAAAAAAAAPAANTNPASTSSEPQSEATGEQDKTAISETPPEPLPPKTFYYTVVVFPPTEAITGSPNDEPDRFEQPPSRERQHRVSLTRPFALLDREVTYEEMIAFRPEPYGVWLAEEGRPSSDPCDGVSWYDSVAFCRWLAEQAKLPETDQAYARQDSLDPEKFPREPHPDANWAPRDWPVDLARRGFRLPTEAEWEVASRAGVRTAFGFGGEAALLHRFGWFQENSGRRIHAGQELRPGPRGLFDMHGNLFEWTHDWYADYGEVAMVDPLGPNGGSYRVIRGGSWGNDAASCRAAYRYPNAPTIRSNYFGFRLALSSPSGQSPEAEQNK